MNREAFWQGLERAYADEDNARFDALHYREQRRRKLRREKILVIGGLITAIFVTFFVYGATVLHLMPYE